MIQPTARAIIHKNGKLLLMRRIKKGIRYYGAIGGHLEAGETPVEACKREVYEETGLKVHTIKQVFLEPASGKFGEQHYFECTVGDGNAVLPENSAEAKDTVDGIDEWEPQWVDKSDIKDLTVMSPVFKEFLLLWIKQSDSESLANPHAG